MAVRPLSASGMRTAGPRRDRLVQASRGTQGAGRRMRRAAQPEFPAPFDRRFEAVVFDWDGTAVPDRHADAATLRALVEELYEWRSISW